MLTHPAPLGGHTSTPRLQTSPGASSDQGDLEEDLAVATGRPPEARNTRSSVPMEAHTPGGGGGGGGGGGQGQG
eukprot:8058830-Pyramimonas_sp.AAC.1